MKIDRKLVVRFIDGEMYEKPRGSLEALETAITKKFLVSDITDGTYLYTKDKKCVTRVDMYRQCVVHDRSLWFMDDIAQPVLKDSIGTDNCILYDEDNFNRWKNYSLGSYLRDEKLVLKNGVIKSSRTYWDRYPADKYELRDLIKDIKTEEVVDLYFFRNYDRDVSN